MSFGALPRCSPRNPGARSRGARNVPRAGPDLREAETPEPEIAKPASKGGSAIPAGGRETLGVAIERFPYLADFSKPLWRAPAKCAQSQPLPGGLRCNPGGSFALNFR